jgi:heme/copper-type cytochrome/quinol oxidase subunit 3
MNVGSEATPHVDAIEPAPISAAKLGIWWFLASEIMVFGGALASFILLRFAGTGWMEEVAHNNVVLGSINTLILITSSFTIVEVLSAQKQGDESKFRKFMAVTVGLGLLFLVIKGVEYSQHFSEGLFPDKSVFWAFYYGLTGLHALHVIAGIVANAALLAVVSRPGGFSKYGHRAEMNGLYWHFVDVVWIFLFPLLYLG